MEYTGRFLVAGLPEPGGPAEVTYAQTVVLELFRTQGCAGQFFAGLDC